ncbi:hypothetical protein V6N11_078144 [Hibiscus sabdariffa]|uniref:RNase H type-1 domain-containing protein n=1 Tax=Hibiscus sabdariffa TaxID=183260 RepID=A0ABR2TG47_9ROSI
MNLTQAWKFVRDANDWDLLFGSLIWLLWLRRNSRIFEPEDVRWESILVQGRCMQQESIVANRSAVRENVQSASVPRCEVRWQQPAVGWHKLNTDGAVCVESGMASCGGVIRTDAGGWVIGFSKRLGIYTALEAELWGVLEGLLSAWSVGIPRLVLEVDSLDAVRLIQQGQAGYRSLSLVNYIVELLSRRWEVRVEHVLHEGNKLADGMTKIVHDIDFLCHRFFDPWVRLLSLLHMDSIE